MKNDVFYNMTDKEKIMLFDLAVESAKENNIDFEKAMDSVIQAFLISKNNSSMDMTPSPIFTDNNPDDINMAPDPKLIDNEPFEFNMAPDPKLIDNEPFEFNMEPSPEFMNTENMQPKDDDTKSSTDVYGGPALEPVDTQKVENSILYF
jgi:hypothetical protein